MSNERRGSRESEQQSFERHLEVLRNEIKTLEDSGANITLEGLHSELARVDAPSQLRTFIHTPYPGQVTLATRMDKSFQNVSFRRPIEQEPLVSRELFYNEAFLTTFPTQYSKDPQHKRIAYDVLAVTAFPDEEIRISLAHHTVRIDGTEYQQKLSTKYLNPEEWRHFGKMFDVVSQVYDKRPARSK